MPVGNCKVCRHLCAALCYLLCEKISCGWFCCDAYDDNCVKTEDSPKIVAPIKVSIAETTINESKESYDEQQLEPSVVRILTGQTPVRTSVISIHSIAESYNAYE